MITIISHGSAVKKFTCKDCSCSFLASEIDYRNENKKIGELPLGYGAKDIVLQWFPRLRCPECGAIVDEVKTEVEKKRW